jgi:hypothetical protein
MPVGARAGQARGFQAEGSASPAEADLGGAGLEAVATGGGGGGAPLALVDRGDGRLRPAQVVAALHEAIPAGSAGGVLAGLRQGRSADVHEGLAVKVVGPNLGGAAGG